MKKLALILALLLPVVAFADEDREILLTSDGALIVAEQVTNVDAEHLDSSATTYVQVTIRRGEDTRNLVVPGTLFSGVHKNPALAYDAASQTLFVFWQRSRGLLHSELLFQTMGPTFEWGPVASFGDGNNVRENLRIAVTRKADTPTEDGLGTASVPQINVHVVWWEMDTYDGQESAQYAMLTIENGVVVESTIHKLFAFIDAEQAATPFIPTEAVPDILKHPSITTSPRQDSATVVFGESRDGSINRVNIRPSFTVVGNARVHIPVGRNEGKTGSPRFSMATNSRVSTIVGGDDRLAFYAVHDNTLQYVLLRNGEWSEMRVLQLDGSITRDAAINAVRRLVEHE